LIQFSKINTPFGRLGVHTNKNGIFRINLPNKHSKYYRETDQKIFTKIHKMAIKELNEYFSRNRKKFDIPIYLNITPFYKMVLNEVTKIPFGKTVSYKEIAKKINHNKAYRAVGLANKNNPIPIIIPCHRVINNNGTIGGYGGGIQLKKKLLQFEFS